MKLCVQCCCVQCGCQYGVQQLLLGQHCFCCPMFCLPVRILLDILQARAQEPHAHLVAVSLISWNGLAQQTQQQSSQEYACTRTLAHATLQPSIMHQQLWV